MSACLPLSDSVRIGFQLHQNLAAQHSNYSYNPQQRCYPRVYLHSEQPRGFAGAVPLETIGRGPFFDMSWEEYCHLVQSKPLAMNILTFRDLTVAPNDNIRSQRPIQINNQSSLSFLPHFNSGITQLNNAMANSNSSFPTNYVVNNNVSFGYSTHNTLLRERLRDYLSQNTNETNQFMSMTGPWCNKTCCVPRTSTSSTFESVAPSQAIASSFAGIAHRDINRIGALGATPITSNLTVRANIPDNLSTIAGGRSSASSGYPYSGPTENPLPTETESGQNDNSDTNLCNYDYHSEATGDSNEFQLSEDEVQAEDQANASTNSILNNFSESVHSSVRAITSTSN